MATGTANDEFLSFVSQWNTQVTSLDPPHTSDVSNSLSKLNALHDSDLVNRSSSTDDLNLSSDLDLNDDSAFEWALLSKKVEHSDKPSAPHNSSTPNDHSAFHGHSATELPIPERIAERERNILSIADEIGEVVNSEDSLNDSWLHDDEEQNETHAEINADNYDNANSKMTDTDNDSKNNTNDAKAKSGNYITKLKGIFRGLYKTKAETGYTKLTDEEQVHSKHDINEIKDSNLVCHQDNSDYKSITDNPTACNDLCKPSNLSAPDILCGLSDDEFDRLMQDYDKDLNVLTDPSSHTTLSDPSTSEPDITCFDMARDNETDTRMGEKEGLLRNTEKSGSSGKTSKDYTKMFKSKLLTCFCFLCILCRT